MDTKDQVVQWLLKMGFDGEIPDTLHQICGPSTASIWNQLMTNVRPKQEADFIRKKIIFNRLEAKPLEEQREFPFPIKQLEVYAKQKELEQQAKALREQIKEKQATINQLQIKNKTKYVQIQAVKKSIEGKEEKTHFLKEKSRLLKKDVQDASEVLTLAKNLTPVELNCSRSLEDVTETLEQCSEKLKKTLEKTPCAPPKMKFVPCEPGSSKSSQSGRRTESPGILSADILNSLGDAFTDDCDWLSKPEGTPKKMTPVPPPIENIDSTLGSKTVDPTLEKLLHGSNRGLILSSWQSICDKLLRDLQTLLFNSNSKENVKINVKESQTELYFLHLMNELEKVKWKKIGKGLEDECRSLKDGIYARLLANRSFQDEEGLKKLLDRYIEDKKLDASLKFLKEELNSLPKDQANNDLEICKAKTSQVKEEIEKNADAVSARIEQINKVLQHIKSNCEDCNCYVRRLRRFMDDMSWATTLTENLISNEIQVFRNFPLKLHGNAWQQPLTFVPFRLKLDVEAVRMLVALIETPYASAEEIFMKLVEAKKTLKGLKASISALPSVEYQKYSLQDLEAKERNNGMEAMVRQLRSLINSSSVREMLSAHSKLEETVEIWVKMPLVQYIPDKRLVEGRNFKYYHKKLSSFVEDLAVSYH